MKALVTVTCLACVVPISASGSEVVAFWGFAEDYDYTANPSKQDFAADVDATASGNANLQAFLGNADELDDNGGDGFVEYTSPTSGMIYAPTRTVKWDDLKGGGDDFDINGTDSFLVDKLDGDGPQSDDFGNDALLYLQLDGSGYADFQLRFDILGTIGDLPSSFDIFYRVDGPDGTWFRDPSQNNVPLAFEDFVPADDTDQLADSGMLSLSPALNNADSIELLISDFAENGNNEMHIDNLELVATAIPEPSTMGLFVMGLFASAKRIVVRR